MELTIPAAPAHLAGLRQAARHALREVPPQIADELVLALNDAATNAILHGSRGGDPVQVAVWVRGGWVEATVVDHGPAQPPHPPPRTDQLSSRGRGLWLLDCLVDEVRWCASRDWCINLSAFLACLRSAPPAAASDADHIATQRG